MVVVGNVGPNLAIPPPHIIVGTYKREDIAAHAATHGIGLWLIPSVWPETYSFTTREALATGLPVLTFDLGAQAEAAAAAPNGHVLKSTDPRAVRDAIEEHFAMRDAQSRVAS